MEVKIGWSAEVRPGEWSKFDVALDSSDFVSYCHENQLEHDFPYRPAVKFKILENLAERMILSYILGHFPDYHSEPLRERAQVLTSASIKLLASLADHKVE